LFRERLLEALIWGIAFFAISLDFVFVLLGLIDVFLFKLLFKIILKK